LVAQRQGKIDNETIITALHEGTWPTVVGDLSWDPNGSPLGTNFLVQWVGNRLLPVYPPDKASASPVAKSPWAG
jgi:branched-chain amino acid transport system substrate-binding protein